MSDGPRNLARELAELKTELRWLQQRLTSLNARLEQLAVTQPEPGPVPPPIVPTTPDTVAEPLPPRPPAQPVVPPPVPPPLPSIAATPPLLRPAESAQAVPAPVPPVAEPGGSAVATTATESFEVRLGTFWLPRIGMGLLLIGMVFLVSWTYRYMGPAGKVALSYACCALLGGLGWWLDKRMEQLARVLQAGALALTYFVTYATHYVGAFRVIESPAVALGLLSVVVALIVVVADRRRSATLAGLALFFGYLTTVISGVAQFTLAANAVLAVAALVFLVRNRWVGLSFGAVLATYLVYVIWAWQVNPTSLLQRFVFDSGYLSAADFRLRAAFLCLYWLLFALGALLVGRHVVSPAERNGLLTLNNAFYFILFWLLVHHAHPGQQWVFLLVFGGVLLVVSALAYQRFAPDRSVMDSLFLQGLVVATLGLISKFHGVGLVAILALESLFLLWLARTMELGWIRWVARAVYGLAAYFALWQLPDWSAPMIHGAGGAALAGYLAARLERREHLAPAAWFFALAATVLAMGAVSEQFVVARQPWAWLGLGVVVALLGVLLRSRETVWLANLPLAWAHLAFLFGNLGLANSAEWTASQALALITVTLAFGLLAWGRARASAAAASQWLLPYLVVSLVALLNATSVQCPARWRLAALALETVLLVLAGFRLREPLLQYLGLVPLAWAHLVFWLWNLRARLYEADQALALIVLTWAVGLLLWGRERAQAEPGQNRAEAWLWPFALVAGLAMVLTTFEFVPREWRLAVLGVQGALLIAAGINVLGWIGLGLAGFGVLHYLGLRSTRLGPPLTATANAVLGWLSILLSARILRVRQSAHGWRIALITMLTILTLFAVGKLLQATLITVSWAGAGFVLLALGFTLRERPYRLAGLVLLGCAVLRVFVYDLAKFDTIYRILSFLGLGVILLVLAYLYTRNRDKVAKWL